MEVLLNMGNFIESEYLHHIFSMSHNNPHIEPEKDDSFLMGPFLNTVVELKTAKLKEKQQYPANVMMAVVLERALEINSDIIKVIPGSGEAVVPFSKNVSGKYINLIKKYEYENNNFVQELLFQYYMDIAPNKTAECAGLFAGQVADILSDGNSGISGNDLISFLINGKLTEYAYSAGSSLDSLQLINYCAKTGINEKFINKLKSKKMPMGLIENNAVITGKKAVNFLIEKAEQFELTQGFKKSLAMGDIDSSSPCLVKAECIHCGMVNTVPFEKISFSCDNQGKRTFPAVLKNGSPCHFCEAPLVGVIFKNSHCATELEEKMDFLEKEFGKENLDIMNAQTREKEFLLPENIEKIIKKISRNKIIQVSPQEFHDFITVLLAAENIFTLKMILSITYDKEPSFLSMEFLEILLKTGDHHIVRSILESKEYLPFYSENSMAKYLTIANVATSLNEMIKVGLMKIEGVELPEDPVQMLISLSLIPPPTDRDDKCPCGSDRRYRNCCQRKKIWDYPISM
ncbi:SEC-C domain-containing protein [Myxococcota bacterium]|nr:SEC-C domain-containing protein [Myxococcota bacterium]